MSARRTHGTDGGFSLTELMVVLALLGILVVLAVPTLRSFYWGWKIKETAQQLSIVIQKARLRAVSTRAPVTVTIVNPVSPDSDITVTVAEVNVATGSMRDNVLKLSKTIRNNILISWRDYDVGLPLSDPTYVLTLNPDGSVTNSEETLADAYNNPPRIEVYDRMHVNSVHPAYLRVSTRGSVITGSLDLTLTAWSGTCYTITAPTPPNTTPPEELRRGIRIATTER